MSCKECGFSFTHHANFCPGCGKKVIEAQSIRLKTTQATKWLKYVGRVILAVLIAGVLLLLISDDMIDVVSDQLKAVKQNRVVEAYSHYSSKSFRKNISLDRFLEFVKTYPVFSHYESVRFIDRNAENGSGSLQAVILTDRGVEIPVLYRLVKEEDGWKISGIQLVGNPPEKLSEQEKNNEAFNSAPLKAVVQGFMDQIRGHHLTNAYEEYTAVDFQKTTTLHDFEGFVNDNPSFSDNQSIELKDLTFDNNIATISGKVKGVDGVEYPVEYDLIQEKGVWKIFHVQVLDSDVERREPSSAVKFSKFVLGSGLDEKGLVNPVESLFKTSSGDIFLNLYADNIPPDATIQVVFEHSDTGSKIPAVSETVADGGDAVLTFIFSPPVSGWPKGNYRLSAIASTGGSGSFDFKVED